jgi:molybdate transport system substrate-binding protein
MSEDITQDFERVAGMLSRRSLLGAIFAVLSATALHASAARAEDILVFAAASLKNALDDIAVKFAQTGGDRAVISYAASSALAKQIESGAPADIFISADQDWMDYVQARNLIKSATRANLAGNDLVLIAPAASSASLKIAPGFPLAAQLGDSGRLAMGDPDHVPAGKYGKAALDSLGVWRAVEKKIARAENVRAALLLVARGEAPFGIVYRTDAMAEKAVRVVDAFLPATHPPIVYPMAQLAASAKPAAARFLNYLKTPAARSSLEAQGFSQPK